MKRDNRKLVFAISILAFSTYLVLPIRSAINLQHDALQLKGCFPDNVIYDTTVTIDIALEKEAKKRGLKGLEKFFFLRKHENVLYLMLACALIGWSGSYLYRLVAPPDDNLAGLALVSTWPSLLASMLLSGIAAAVLFALFVGVRLIIDPSEACIGKGLLLLAAAASVGSGFFVVRFIRFFRSIVDKLWNYLSKGI